MHLLPVTIVGSYNTQCFHPRLYYFDDQDLTLVCCENTKQCYLLRQDATLLENNLIDIELAKAFPMSSCGLLLATAAHDIFTYTILARDRPMDEEHSPPMKKAKLEKSTASQYQKLFQARGTVDWVQHVDSTTLYALSVASGCMYIYDFGSAQLETVPLPQHLTRSWSTCHPTCFSKVMPDLDPIFADHFGISRSDGALMGFDNGSVFYIPPDNSPTDIVMLIQIQFEAIIGIHACRVPIDAEDADIASTAKDLLIFAGSNGTIQLYSKASIDESHQAIHYKEFSLPSSVISISFAKDSASALVFCTNSVLYLMEFSPSTTGIHHKDAGLLLQLTQLQSPDDIFSIHYISKHQQTITYQVVSTTGYFSTCKVDLESSPVIVTRTPDRLKKVIHDTLAELSELESNQIKMDSHHEDIDRQLISLNRTLHALQNASSRKKKNKSIEFGVEIIPVVKQAFLTGQPQPCLRIRIQTTLLLNWADWQLNIDIEHQRTTKQESDSIALNIPDYVMGKSISLPLNGFDSEEDATGLVQTWERDLELNLQDHPLPLGVNICVSLNTDTTRMVDKNTPTIEYLPINNNASNNRTNFPVTFMTVDYLHFAMPLTKYHKQQLKKNGLRDLTNRMQNRWNGDTANRSLETDNKFSQSTLAFDTLTIKLRFVTSNNTDELYRSILSTLLSEGKSSDVVRQLCDDAEHAYLSLATHPMYPITITLSKVNATSPGTSNDDLCVDMKLQCLNAFVLINTEASILARIQPYTNADSDGDGDDSFSNNFDSTAFYKTHQQLEKKLESLEQCYKHHYQQNGVDEDDLWQELRGAWDLSQQLHQDLRLSLYDFRI